MLLGVNKRFPKKVRLSGMVKSVDYLHEYKTRLWSLNPRAFALRPPSGAQTGTFLYILDNFVSVCQRPRI